MIRDENPTVLCQASTSASFAFCPEWCPCFYRTKNKSVSLLLFRVSSILIMGWGSLFLTIWGLIWDFSLWDENLSVSGEWEMCRAPHLNCPLCWIWVLSSTSDKTQEKVWEKYKLMIGTWRTRQRKGDIMWQSDRPSQVGNLTWSTVSLGDGAFWGKWECEL